MNDFFKESDCDIRHCSDVGISLDKTNRLLIEQGVPVQGWINGTTYGFGSAANRVLPGADTHTALLINILPINQDTPEKFVADFVEYVNSFERGEGEYIPDAFNKLSSRAKKLLEGK